jgi:hypothetical protein
LLQHVLQRIDPVSENAVDTDIDQPIHRLGIVDGPDMDLLSRPMGRLQQARGEYAKPSPADSLIVMLVIGEVCSVV